MQVVGETTTGQPVLEVLPDAPRYRVTEAGTLSPVYDCECGYTVPVASKNPAAALRMHRMSAKQHREPVSA
jgi:hypothetical protein